jgi:hypothetical protein
LKSKQNEFGLLDDIENFESWPLDQMFFDFFFTCEDEGGSQTLCPPSFCLYDLS